VYALPRLANRLLLVGDPDNLLSFSETLSSTPELRLHAEVISAVAIGNVSDLVRFGANAAQSAVLPLLSGFSKIECKLTQWSQEKSQAVGVFEAHGLNGIVEADPIDYEMYEFCSWNNKGGVVSKTDSKSVIGVL
jgi:hypothetical protein